MTAITTTANTPPWKKGCPCRAKNKVVNLINVHNPLRRPPSNLARGLNKARFGRARLRPGRIITGASARQETPTTKKKVHCANEPSEGFPYIFGGQPWRRPWKWIPFPIREIREIRGSSPRLPLGCPRLTRFQASFDFGNMAKSELTTDGTDFTDILSLCAAQIGAEGLTLIEPKRRNPLKRSGNS